MSDSKEPINPLEELQKQLQEALKNSNFGFQFHNKPNQEQETKDLPELEAPSPSNSNKPSDEEILERIHDFNLKPREIRDHLNRFVIKQQEAKKVLSVAICDHYNYVRQCLNEPTLLDQEYTKQNILLLGPTGVGKTYLMRNIAKLIGVPFVKADATKFSETGYVGADVEDLVRDLVKVANGNINLAQYGIIYIDEIDKIASESSGQGKDISGRGVQINLLKLMEDSEVNLFSPNDMMSQMQAMMDMSMGGNRTERKKTISTRNILFIVSGAFDKLAESIKRRVDKSEIGFGSSPTDREHTDHYLKEAQTTDFIKYGFEPEFIGRLPVRVACESLNAEDLVGILKSSEGSILRQYRQDFNGYGIHFDISDDAIKEIARKASLERTGARGLLTVLEQAFRDFKFELPSTAIKSFDVSTDTIANPKKSLKKLLAENKPLQETVLEDDLKRFTDYFEKQHNFKLIFTAEATKALIDDSIEQDKTIRALCEEKFKDFQHGLQIIERNTGERIFTIDQNTAKNADRELSQWVVNSFKKPGAQEKQKPKKTAKKKNATKKSPKSI